MANYTAAIPFPEFQPAMRNILSISQAFPAVVVTTFDGTTPGVNQYLDGLIVRLVVPLGFGMVQADQFSGPITIIDTTSFSLPIDTTTFDPFVIPSYQPGFNGTPAQVVPVGELNGQLNQATQNVLPYP